MTNRYQFKLRFNKKDLPKWEERFRLREGLEPVLVLCPKVKEQGFYSKEELQSFCYWKTPRSRSRVARNLAEYVESITQVALSTSNERLRIEILLLLSGVNWPTASVLLHFGHSDPYPILDFRALWSVGIENPQAMKFFDAWWEYTKYCRQLADETGLSMRELDRALWQYSKEKQNAEQ
jgi:hypothetical protein